MATQLGIFDVLKMIFILAVILLLTYYASKLLAAKAAGVGSSRSFFSMMGNGEGGDELPRVIHRTMLNKDSMLVLLEYNGLEYMLAVSSSNVQVLDKRELAQDEIDKRKNQRDMKEQNGFSFSKYMDEHMKKVKDSQTKKGVDKD